MLLLLVPAAAGLLAGAAHRRPARPAQLARASRPAMAESLTERLMRSLPAEEQTGGAVLARLVRPAAAAFLLRRLPCSSAPTATATPAPTTALPLALPRPTPHLCRRRSEHTRCPNDPRVPSTLTLTLNPPAGAGGQSTYESLLGFNAAWEKLKAGEVARPRQVVSPGATPSAADYDLVIVGGNLGILLATALAVRGLRVAVVEAGVLRGRNQDWNAALQPEP